MLACGNAPQQLCDQETTAICQGVFSCFSATERADAGFIALYGQSQSDCINVVGTNKCKDVTAAHPCGGNTQQTYNQAAAQQCLASTQSASCDQLRDPTFRPAGCDQACQ